MRFLADHAWRRRYGCRTWRVIAFFVTFFVMGRVAWLDGGVRDLWTGHGRGRESQQALQVVLMTQRLGKKQYKSVGDSFVYASRSRGLIVRLLRATVVTWPFGQHGPTPGCLHAGWASQWPDLRARRHGIVRCRDRPWSWTMPAACWRAGRPPSRSASTFGAHCAKRRTGERGVPDARMGYRSFRQSSRNLSTRPSRCARS